MAEELRGSRKIGTTLRGIGPAYEDKAGAARPAHGRPAAARSAAGRSWRRRARHYEQVCRGAAREPDVDWDALLRDLAGFGERLRPRIADVSLVLHRADGATATRSSSRARRRRCSTSTTARTRS